MSLGPLSHIAIVIAFALAGSASLADSGKQKDEQTQNSAGEQQAETKGELGIHGTLSLELSDQIKNVMAPIYWEYGAAHKFFLDPLQADLMKLLVRLKLLKPEDVMKACNDRAENGSYNNDVEGDAIWLFELIVDSMLSALEETRDLQWTNYSTSIASYIDDYMRRHPEYLDGSKYSAAQAADAILADERQRWAPFQYLVDDGEHETFNEVIAYRLVHAKTDDDWKSALREAAKVWSPDEKIEFIQGIGGDFARNYEYPRAENSMGGGVRTVLDVLHGLETRTPTGVCRDIASAQGLMAKELGFENVYVMTYASGGNHVVLIMQDPTNKRKVIKINYDSKNVASDVKEAHAISVDRDRSMSYVVYEPGGKMVAHVPSEVGLMMSEQTGFDVQEIDPFARSTAPVVASASVQKGRFRGNLFSGVLTDGSVIVGAAMHRHFGKEGAEIAAGKLGIGYAFQEGGRDYLAVHQLYGRYRQILNSPWLEHNDRLRSRIETSGDAMGDLSIEPAHKGPNDENVRKGLAGSYHVYLNGGVVTEAESITGNQKATLTASSQAALGTLDIRDMDWKKYRLFHNLSYVDLAGQTKVTDEWKALADVALGFRYFGPQIMTSGGAKYEDLKREASALIKAGYKGALNDNQMAIAPGRSRAVFLDLEGELKKWKLKLEYEQPILGAGEYTPSIRGNISGSFGGKHRPKKEKISE